MSITKITSITKIADNLAVDVIPTTSAPVPFPDGGVVIVVGLSTNVDAYVAWRAGAGAFNAGCTSMQLSWNDVANLHAHLGALLRERVE